MLIRWILASGFPLAKNQSHFFLWKALQTCIHLYISDFTSGGSWRLAVHLQRLSWMGEVIWSGHADGLQRASAAFEVGAEDFWEKTCEITSPHHGLKCTVLCTFLFGETLEGESNIDEFLELHRCGLICFCGVWNYNDSFLDDENPLVINAQTHIHCIKVFVSLVYNWSCTQEYSYPLWGAVRAYKPLLSSPDKESSNGWGGGWRFNIGAPKMPVTPVTPR